MKPIARRLLAAYRPLYQRGLLMDGRLPPAAAPAPAPGRRHRVLLAALTGLQHIFSPIRSKP